MSYLRKARCPLCGEPNWFRYWVGKHCANSRDGLCVTDCDLVFHRFKRVDDRQGRRNVEHLMIVEVKIEDERLGDAQRDSLSVTNATMNSLIMVDGKPINVKSRPGMIVRSDKKIIWHGIHLLRIPAEEPKGGETSFVWDGQDVPEHVLARVLSFDCDPNRPSTRLDIDRRHKPARTYPLWKDTP